MTSVEFNISIPQESSNNAMESKQRRLNLMELVNEITTEFKGDKDLTKIRQCMEDYDASLNEWKRYAHFDPEKKYTRNLIATDNETFALMLLIWNCHKASPIHSHAGSECFMRCVDGQVVEIQYEWPEHELPSRCINTTTSATANGSTSTTTTIDACCEQVLKKRKSTVLHAGQVAYINDSLGLHKVENDSNEKAATLHLYMPPYQSCLIWTDENAKSCEASMTYFSENGEIVEHM